MPHCRREMDFEMFSLLGEILLILPEMLSPMFFLILGGWFELTLIHLGVLAG